MIPSYENWESASDYWSIDRYFCMANNTIKIKMTGGNISTDTLDFDGTPGISASTSSNQLTTPRNMIVIYRDGKPYLLMAGANAGIDAVDAVSHIRESWNWKQRNAE